jgi:hypothetical protein
MFNDRFGLTDAVLEGRKTMTRRIIKCTKKAFCFEVGRSTSGGCLLAFCNDKGTNVGEILAKYKVGEVVAIEQAYKDIYPNADFKMVGDKFMTESPGWKNKMFTRPSLMPHHIKITDIKVERLQHIPDADCLSEGVYSIKSEDVPQINETGVFYYTFCGASGIWTTPRKAFAALIDKVGKKGTWSSNPWVFCYSFELID